MVDMMFATAYENWLQRMEGDGSPVPEKVPPRWPAARRPLEQWNRAHQTDICKPGPSKRLAHYRPCRQLQKPAPTSIRILRRRLSVEHQAISTYQWARSLVTVTVWCDRSRYIRDCLQRIVAFRTEMTSSRCHCWARRHLKRSVSSSGRPKATYWIQKDRRHALRLSLLTRCFQIGTGSKTSVKRRGERTKVCVFSLCYSGPVCIGYKSYIDTAFLHQYVPIFCKSAESATGITVYHSHGVTL